MKRELVPVSMPPPKRSSSVFSPLGTRLRSNPGLCSDAISLGWIISLVLIRVVDRQSFHWSMELFAPWMPLVGGAALILALSTITAVAVGRQAMGEEAILAVKDDW